jgi:hypothetical protein
LFVPHLAGKPMSNTIENIEDRRQAKNLLYHKINVCNKFKQILNPDCGEYNLQILKLINLELAEAGEPIINLLSAYDGERLVSVNIRYVLDTIVNLPETSVNVADNVINNILSSDYQSFIK